MPAKIIADTHTHTLACDHAYSTFLENAEQAKAVGLEFLCSTEHACTMPGAPSLVYFKTLRNLPRTLCGVTILRGAELNVLDFNGKVDLPDEIIGGLEWVIASCHRECLIPADEKSHTNGWIKIAENPKIHVIGHCGDSRFSFEKKAVIQAFRDTGKIVEINAHSFDVRPGSRENCRAIASLCAEFGVRVVVSSDAHHSSSVGDVGAAVRLLEEIGFPEELILNADSARFKQTVENLGVNNNIWK